MVVEVGEADVLGFGVGEGDGGAGGFGEGEDVFADFAEGFAIGADGDGDGFGGADLGSAEDDEIQHARLLEVDGDVLRELVGVAGGVAVRREGGPGAVSEAGVPAVGVFVAAGPGAAFSKIVAEVGIDGPVGVEGGGGQAVAIHEVGDGELAPREAGPTRLRDLRGGEHDAVAIDFGLGGLEKAIAAGDLEMRERFAIACGEAAGGVVELHTDGGAFDAVAGVERTAGVDVGLAVGLCHGPEREAAGDFFFLRGMDVRHLADVADDGHAGVRDVEALCLRLPELREDLRLLSAVLEGGDLHEVERQLGLLEHAAPGGEQGLFLVGINEAFIVVRLALIPDGAAEGEGHERMDHGMVERGGRAGVGGECLRLAGHGGHGLIFLQRGLHGLLPLRDGGEVLFMRGAIRLAAGQVRADIGDEVLQLRHGIKAINARPRLDTCAAPSALNDADGHFELLVQFQAEVITDRRKASGCLWRAAIPFRGHIVLRRERGRFWHLDEAQIRMRGVRDVGLRVGLHLHFPLHVRLAGGEPHLADQNVLHAHVARLEHLRLRVCGHGFELHHPLAARIGFRGLLLSRELHDDFLTGRGFAPNRHRFVPLKHHVVGEDGGKLHRSMCGRSEQEEIEERLHGQ